MAAKMKKESSYSFVEKEYVCEVLKLLKLSYEFKFASPQSKILSFKSRQYNYITENE